MLKDFSTSRFNAAFHLRLFKQLFICCLSISASVYLALHIIFFDLELDWKEELTIILKVTAVAAAFAAGISSAFLVADLVQLALKKWNHIQPVISFKKWAVALLLLIISISACYAQPALTGLVKEPATGLVATCKGLKPGKVFLQMNNEVIHHTDIPLGESFILINSGVKGLTVKNDKVSVGCSLLIKNRAGKMLLQVADLFKGTALLDKDSAQVLRCTVSTGEPMKWEEKYSVSVIFWDKFGTGKIENKVTIRCIDIP